MTPCTVPFANEPPCSIQRFRDRTVRSASSLGGWPIDSFAGFIVPKTFVEYIIVVLTLVDSRCRRGCRILVLFKGAVFDFALQLAVCLCATVCSVSMGAAIFNVWSEKKLKEKLDYMHRNPVTRKLVLHPKDWAWSSWSHYEKRETGLIRIDALRTEEASPSKLQRQKPHP